MVKLRLKRRGRKSLPIYDIVATDSRSPRDGRFIERVGQYNALVGSGATMLNRERALYWLQTGAQPTDTVRNIFSKEGILLEMYMGMKGASAAEVNAAVEKHLELQKQKLAQKSVAKATKKEEPVADEAPQEVAATEEAAPVEAVADEQPVAEAEAPAEATGADENVG